MKEISRLADKLIRQGFGDVVEVDQIAVDIAQQIAVVIGIEENSTGADERLNQALTFRQMLAQCIDDAGFAAEPFKGGPVHTAPLLQKCQQQ